MSTYPRPHPEGGWYCEHGTARGPACSERATWVLSSCADSPGRYPGAATCEAHRVLVRGCSYVLLPPPARAPEGGKDGAK